MTWLITSLLSPTTRKSETPKSDARRSPSMSARYSDSLFVNASPRYCASVKTTRPPSFEASPSSLIKAPAPDGPGFPRHAPSKQSRYRRPEVKGGVVSASIDASSIGASSFAFSTSSSASASAAPADPAMVLMALRAGGGRSVGGRAPELGRARDCVGLAAGERRRALSLGPASPTAPPRCAATHAAASASVPKDLCTAPLMPVTCALASSHVRYTPGSRPRATP
mmetsp:Transcript_1640/g.6530  ORF Transcript_1640/g.6530 Transcript_1640/m.6530 type:complete len:225 (+) Transcript_1640:1213-1887(+)